MVLPLWLACTITAARPHLDIGVEASIAEGLQAHECCKATHGQAHAGVRPEGNERNQAQRWPCRMAPRKMKL